MSDLMNLPVVAWNSGRTWLLCRVKKKIYIFVRNFRPDDMSVSFVTIDDVEALPCQTIRFVHKMMKLVPWFSLGLAPRPSTISALKVELFCPSSLWPYYIF